MKLIIFEMFITIFPYVPKSFGNELNDFEIWNYKNLKFVTTNSLTLKTGGAVS